MSNAAAGGGAAGSAVVGTTSGMPLSAEYPVDVLSGQRNPRGIPQMLFFDEDLAAFFASRRAPIDGVLQSLQTMHGKFKLMESALLEQRKRCRATVPDLESSLAVVRMLQRKREELGAPGGGGGGGSNAAAAAGGGAAEEPAKTFATYFNLSEQVFAEASVAPTGRCAVWLGANVMLEYSYEEAEAMLAANLEAARRKTVETEEDVLYLKDNLTTTEVNMSRTYNFEVAQRRAAKAAAALAAAGGSAGGAGGGGGGGGAAGGGSPGKSGVSARITLGGKEVRLPL